jgi:hypothetical protein
LFRYLLDNNKLEDVQNADADNLHIISDNVLEMIHNNEPGWEKFVPRRAEEVIKENGLFGYEKRGISKVEV